MVNKELLKTIRRIEIHTNRLVDAALAGDYHSVFKGQGMEYEEVRQYQPGDDVRSIDWNVSSRSGILHIKKYREERELTAVVLVDGSASSRFGTGEKAKEEVAAEITAILAFAAIRNNDRVGAILFTGAVEKYIPPRKGQRHVLRLVREVLGFEPAGRTTSIAAALEYATRVLKKRSILFIISDFFDTGYTDALRLAARKHEVVAVSLADRGDAGLPRGGWVRLRDPEDGRTVLLPAFLPGVRKRHRQQLEEAARLREGLFRKYGIDHVQLPADTAYDGALVRFFRQRAGRVRR